MTASDLFEYRLRKQGVRWYIFHDNYSYWFPTFQAAKAYSEFLDRSGYVNGDNHAAD